MRILINLKLVLFFAVLLISLACVRNENDTENQKVATFESIEKGVSLEDARATLAEKYSEMKVGSQPDIDIILLEDGRQLVFVDNVLTDKNTASAVDSVITTKTQSQQD